MPTLAERTRTFRALQAPVDLGEYYTGTWTANTWPVTITRTFSNQKVDFDRESLLHQLVASWFAQSPSRTHAAEMDALTRNFWRSVYRRMEGLAKPYDEGPVADQFDYESVIRPVTHRYRGRLHLKGRAQPLPIDRDD